MQQKEPHMLHNQVLEDKEVILRPLTEEDVVLLARWFSDPEIVHWLQLSEDPPHLRTIEAVRERYQQMQADPFTSTWRIDTKDSRPIGQIELVNIHPLQRRAEMHLCIGEKDLRGRGYGTQAIRLLLQHVFDELHLRRVYLTPDEDNERAIHCFQKCGFVREGVLREHRLRYGQPINMVMMGILSKEFRGND